MDGIPVKISEKYKPPRRITLPASIQNKLSSELKLEKYDFQLEHLVIEEMAKLKEQQTMLSESKESDDKQVVSKSEENISDNYILQPMPLKPFIQPIRRQVGEINIRDFENDESSPFDSVELKTLDDMEELRHVLSELPPTTSPPNLPSSHPTSPRSASLPSSPPSVSLQSRPPSVAASQLQNGKSTNESTIILKNLQKHLEERRATEILRNKAEEVKKPEEPLPVLKSAEEEGLVQRMGEMGFPLPRAARATQIYGPNESKVIEFLLEVQSLEEAGHQSDLAERAFVISSYSRDGAQQLLETVSQLSRLGFKEDSVIEALVRSGLDRDKALDSLIS